MWTEIGTLVGIPVLRSIGGWIENAFEDGVISKLEWTQLFGTVLRVGMIGTGLWLGFDMSALAASGSAIVADFLLKALKK